MELLYWLSGKMEQCDYLDYWGAGTSLTVTSGKTISSIPFYPVVFWPSPIGHISF